MNFLDLFNSTFVNYYDNKVPMWSNWNYDKFGMQIKIAVPGYEKEAFDLSVNDDELQLKIEDGKRLRTYSVITRQWDTAYDLEKAKATYKNGMLIIDIPKEDQKKALPSKKIEISY
jgi:HSP20 family molecular chaperone IbpA